MTDTLSQGIYTEVTLDMFIHIKMAKYPNPKLEWRCRGKRKGVR